MVRRTAHAFGLRIGCHRAVDRMAADVVGADIPQSPTLRVEQS